MVRITMQVTERLAQQLQPMSDWLPTILELSLIRFKTSAVQTASEIMDFLASSPTPTDLLNYHVSDRAQERLQRLLARLNILSSCSKRRLMSKHQRKTNP